MQLGSIAGFGKLVKKDSKKSICVCIQTQTHTYSKCGECFGAW